MELRQQKKYDELAQRFEKMQSRRSHFDAVWQRIAELADAKSANFTVEDDSGSYREARRKTDSTLSMACPKWASAIDGLTTPKTQKWHGLTLTDPELAEQFKDWLDRQRDRLFAIRYSAGSNFANANHENLVNIGYYGSGPFSVTEQYGKGIIYRAWSVREFYVENNFNGEVDTFFRKFKLNTRQAIQQFQDKAPKQVRMCEELSKEWEFLHCIYPNEDYQYGRFDGPRKKIASVYLCLTTKEIVEEGGYDICPFFYPRYAVSASNLEPYGYSPTMMFLPEVRTLMSMNRTNLRVGQRMGDPTYLLANDDLMDPDRIMQPGAVVPGGVDGNGKPLAMPLAGPNTMPYSLEMIQDMRNVIKEGFELNLFSVLVNKPDMTATEVLQRAQETATLLSPITSRYEREFLSGCINKEFEIALRAGQLEDMPEELAMALSSGQVQLQVQYESPIRRAQNANEGQAVLQTLQVAMGLQQLDPSIKNKINAHRALEVVADSFGAPGKIFNTQEEQQAADMNDVQMAQAAQMLEAAPVMSQSAKNLADAQSKVGTRLI